MLHPLVDNRRRNNTHIQGSIRILFSNINMFIIHHNVRFKAVFLEKKANSTKQRSRCSIWWTNTNPDLSLCWSKIVRCTCSSWPMNTVLYVNLLSIIYNILVFNNLTAYKELTFRKGHIQRHERSTDWAFSPRKSFATDHTIAYCYICRAISLWVGNITIGFYQTNYD